MIWIMHGSLINSDEAGVADQVADAKNWYQTRWDSIDECGCCGKYTGGYTGNVNCDLKGKRDLEDIMRLKQ